MSSRLFLRLLLLFLLVIAVATAALDWTIRSAWERSLRRQIELSLKEKTALVADGITRADDPQWRARVPGIAAAAAARVTVIDRSGAVLADSEADPAAMENHAARPEFAAALAGRMGEATRRSATVDAELLYVAVPVPSGAVRLAYPLSAIAATTHAARVALLKSSLLAFFLAAVVAALLARSVSRRLTQLVEFAGKVAAGDLQARAPAGGSDEIARVAAALNVTAERMQEKFAETERQRQEMETLLNSMSEPVLAVAASGVVQWSNGAMERMAGRPVTPGTRVEDVIRAPELLSTLRTVLRDGTTASTRLETFAPRRAFDVTVAPMPGGAVCAFHDLTEIERAETTRRDFIANVSHELRTPLTSVHGYVETLLASAAAYDPQTREFLEVIGTNAARMKRLTEDLLTLARVESGELKLELEPVSARELLESAAREFSAGRREAAVKLIVQDAPPVEVMVDRNAISQVFSNLLDNAVKYASEGGRIEVGALPENGQVDFYVRDFGPGIASEHLPRLFERFYRVDKARSITAGGTGLGLAIVKHIVQNHGGSVRADSILGQGSTFHFILPAGDAPSARM